MALKLLDALGYSRYTKAWQVISILSKVNILTCSKLSVKSVFGEELAECEAGVPDECFNSLLRPGLG